MALRGGMFSRKHWYHLGTDLCTRSARKDVPLWELGTGQARASLWSLDSPESRRERATGPVAAQAYVSRSYDSVGGIMRESRDAMI